MRMNFLCQSYLNWLRTRPLESLSTWSQSFELGAHLQDEHLWAESVNPLGTAYEIAYVLVCQELDKKPLTEKSGQLSQSAASRLDESAMRLMFSLCRLKESWLKRLFMDYALSIIDMKVYSKSSTKSTRRNCYKFSAFQKHTIS